MTLVIETRGLVKRYDDEVAVAGIDLEVGPGEIYGLVGPNGAGKTTTMRILATLLAPTAGEARVAGIDVMTDPIEVRRRIGYMPDFYGVYDDLRVWEYLDFFARCYGVPAARRAGMIGELLEIVGLPEKRDAYVEALSRGMRQRLCLAHTLVHDPQLLILDEPTVGVDVEARHQIWAHVRSLRAAGRTFVLTTNYLDEAEALCDRVAILRAGKLIAEDTPAALEARTGRCLELECWQEGAARIYERLQRHSGVLRAEIVDFGLRLYLAVDISPEDIVREARTVCAIEGFRTRSPDLVEVVRALTAASAPS